jgi:putative glycosyltransferase (TIGR04372 family)
MPLEQNKGIYFKIYFTVLLKNFKKNGFLWVFKRLFLRILRELIWLLLLPLTIVLHYAGFRRILVKIEHIGHLTTELDTFIKAECLGMLRRKRHFVLANINKVANPYLLRYWQRHFTIITHPWLCTILEILSRHYFLRDRNLKYTVECFGTQAIYQINRLWGERPPILQLDKQDVEWGNQQLANLGIHKDQWFVCLHVREGGFLPQNEIIQSHRNASVTNTLPAIKEIIRRGGFVLRMGDASMTPLPKLDGLIDYANHPIKSDRLDIILCAKAKFFLGCTSGLAFLSMIFGVPIAQANMIPTETLGIRCCDISIPKLLLNSSQGSYLNFKDIMQSNIGGFFFTQQYIDAGIQYEENKPEDILALVLEMFDRLEKNFQCNHHDEKLHDYYMSFFKPGHYSYGALSRVCIAFLKRYQHLIT